MFRLYAYADSSDLYDVEQELLRAFEDFSASWPVTGVRLTNKKAPLMEGQHSPDWNIGLRVETATLTAQDLEQLLSFLSKLSRMVNLRFVLGTWERQVIGTRDICFVDLHIPDGAVGLLLEESHAL